MNKTYDIRTLKITQNFIKLNKTVTNLWSYIQETASNNIKTDNCDKKDGQIVGQHRLKVMVTKHKHNLI